MNRRDLIVGTMVVAAVLSPIMSQGQEPYSPELRYWVYAYGVDLDGQWRSVTFPTMDPGAWLDAIEDYCGEKEHPAGSGQLRMTRWASWAYGSRNVGFRKIYDAVLIDRKHDTVIKSVMCRGDRFSVSTHDVHKYRTVHQWKDWG